MIKYISLLLLITCLSCNKKNNNEKIVHPTLENINPDIGVSNNISISDTNYSKQAKVRNIVNRIVNKKTLFTIGEKEGKSYDMLGDVKDVHIDEKLNQIYILDSQNIGINVHNMKGEFLYTITREGRGPGELTNPSSIEVQDNQAYILDDQFNIKTFSLEDEEFEYSNTISTGFPPIDFCLMDDQIFVKSITVMDNSSLDNKNNIFAYEQGDYAKPLNNFGTQYKSNSWHAIFSMSIGAGIGCNSKTDIIIQYFQSLNLLYAYNKDGMLLWLSRLEDFNFLKIIEVPGRSMGPDPNNLQGNFDSLENVIALGEDFFLVQVANKTMTKDGARKNRIKTFIINNKDGSGFYIKKELPFILSLTDSKIAFYSETEFPIVTISEY